MKPFITAALLFSAFPVWAEPNCSRGELQRATNSYIAAQQAGDPSLMPLEGVTHYIYNMNDSTLDESIVNIALAIDHHRSFMDTTTCQTYTEVVVADPVHPFVLATRLRMVAGRVLEMESVVTDEGDLFFDADTYLEKSSSEDWHPLSASERVSRTELVAAANAYFDQFFSGPKSTSVPWGRPCNRLEGGIYSGSGAATDSCDVGVPAGMNIANRRFLVDEVMGTVVGLVKMGPDLWPDSHMFRLVNGKIRYVHTLTVCEIPGCGLGAPAGD